MRSTSRVDATQSRLTSALLAATVALCAGCACCRDYFADRKLEAQAKNAYQCSDAAECFDGYSHDFKKGFQCGYCDVAHGSNGCPPPLPPDHYRSHRLQNCDGHEQINSWFAGYSAGAAAAVNEGVQSFNYLPSPHRESLPIRTGDPYEHGGGPTLDPENVRTPEAVSRLLPSNSIQPTPLASSDASACRVASFDTSVCERLPPVETAAPGAPRELANTNFERAGVLLNGTARNSGPPRTAGLASPNFR